MDKKIIILIVAIIIVIATITVININKNKTNNISQQIQQTTLDLETNQTIEENLKNAIEECKNMYTQYGSVDFDVYFSVDFINNYMENGNISLADDIESKDFSFIKIYDIAGNELEEFPKTLSSGEELKYEKDAYKIEENKTYLIKVYSYENSYSYYYTMQICKKGNATLVPVCYTIGEIDDSIYVESIVEAE